MSRIIHNSGIFSDAVAYAYNTHFHFTTGLNPFELVFNRPPSQIIIELHIPPADKLKHGEFKMRWLRQLKHLSEVHKINSVKARDHYNSNFDQRLRRIKHTPVKSGSVLLRCVYASDDSGGKRKLASTADGPFLVRNQTGAPAFNQRGRQL